ncbi:hydrogenase expression protein HupH [Corynebacterium diphtheriae]|nr:hydrogenase expression protein HupH [Corynebacterium diphtheriae]
MHELGLLSGVVSAAESSIPSGKNRRVLRIALRVGARSGAIPEALEGAWPIASSGSVCDGAELLIDFLDSIGGCNTVVLN